MRDLITIVDSEPVVSTLTIAEQDGVPEHASILKIIRNHLKDFEHFGTLGFEIQKSRGRPTEYANLNERQATLLFTYMRNSEPVRAFKIRLVSEFYRMAEEEKQRNIGPQCPQELATRVARATLELADLINAPRHYALQVTGQQIYRETGIDHSLLIGSSPDMQNIEEEYLEPTECGERLGLSAKAFNPLLHDAGLQTRRNKSWAPTDAGRDLCIKHAWSKGSKSGYNLKWKFSAIQELLA